MSALKTRFAAQATKMLRANMTDAERKLWARLRNRQFLGFKFVRQHPVGPYIADFACRDADLIVELDGGQHADNREDLLRTQALREHGYSLIRFWNDEVLTNIDGVLTVLMEHLGKASSPGLRFAKTDLSPEGRGVEGATVIEGKTL
ncbi:MAG TPA: endonuclease domain-containing protein [Devosia sp.]|jgi:very-short-patch-repair endonuclease|nr:endonuclease domain-containing protein [Devosia sp.]